MGHKRSRKQRSSVKCADINNVFNRTAIATALAVAIAPIDVAVAGSVRNTPWGRNIEMFVVPTTERVLFGAQLLEPLLGNAQSLTYGDLRAIYNPSNTEELNLGIGHRRYFGSNWLLGGYLSFDTRETERNKRHNQLTFGLEALSQQWDFNFNYYLPLSSEKVVGLGTLGGTFIGNRFLANGVVEEALEGFDAEIGALLPFVTIGETRLYIGGYHFDGEVAPSTGAGLKARLEFRPRKDINLGVTVQNDDLFGTEAMFQIKYSFGYAGEPGVRTLDERMIQFHERDIDIKDTSPVDDLIMESGDPSHRVVVFNDVVHIDNVKGSTAGNGSFERPYDSFATCIGRRCDRPGTVVYVGAGGKSSTVTTYDTTTFNMRNNQLFFGRGVELFGFGGDAFPTLTAAGNAINLANNNEIAGFIIDGAGGQGIYGFNSTGFNIHDNRIINSAANGIALFFDETGPKTVTGQINNNIINSNGSNGIYIYTNLDPAVGTFSQAIAIANNTISNNTNDGIRISTDIYGESKVSALTLNQTFNISGNTIKNNDDGIYIVNYVGDEYVELATTLNQVVSISNNTISNNNDNGIHIYNETDSDASVLNQTLSITDNLITGNSDNGIYIDFYNDYFSTIKFKGTITGNTITGNGEDGININFDSYENGKNNLNILIDNNRIAGNADKGIEIYFDNNYTTSGVQKVVISNNVISNNASDGVYIDTYFDDDAKVSQSFSFLNNTIENNGGDGIRIYNDGYLDPGGSFSQTVNLSGNVIRNNAGDGVRLWHYNDGDGTATQSVEFTDNTITGNGNYDVAIYNASDADSVQNVTSGGGNTIGSIYVDGDGTQSVTLP